MQDGRILSVTKTLRILEFDRGTYTPHGDEALSLIVKLLKIQ